MMVGILATILMAKERKDDRAILTIDEPLGDDVKLIVMDIEYGFGSIRIKRGNASKAVTGFIQYNTESIRPSFRYEVDGDEAHFEMETKSRRRNWNFNWNDDYESPECELYLNPKVPLEIDFTCGLGEAELDLGHLKIRDLRIASGLGESTLDFSTLNGIEMRRLVVNNGLGEMTVKNLSNANTDDLSFDCGLGSADLDFDGTELRDMRVDVNVGLGEMILRIPRRYRVELRTEENFLSSIDTHGMVQIRRGLYRSRNYDDDGPVLHISASVGLGSIDVKWID